MPEPVLEPRGATAPHGPFRFTLRWSPGGMEVAIISERERTFSPTIRLLGAVVAAVLLFDTWRWSHHTPIQIAYGCVGALAFGSFAVFGSNRGWRRYAMVLFLMAFFVLSVWRLVIRGSF